MTSAVKNETSVLIIENDADTRVTLTQLLEAEGYAVTAVPTAPEAFAYLHAHARPSVILLDLMMPGMTGWEFRQRQLQDPGLMGVPIVILSGVADAVARVNGLGEVSYLQKPVEPEDLLAVVRRHAVPQRPGVLVVDDEAMLRQMLERGLRLAGFEVFAASNGEEALVLFDQHAQEIDVLLLDVQMPDLDGPQTLHALRQTHPHLPCCFMTGYAGRYTLSDLEKMRAIVIQKPFRLAEMTRLLRDMANA